jgi:hypothetical protein
VSRGGKKKEQTLTQVMARLLEKELVPDLVERAGMPGVEAALRARWEREKAARRTADAFEIWVKHTVEQVGAAWILSVAFIRTLEDRGLLQRRRIAGHEAYDSEHGFFRLFPALGPRDYLLTVFRELSRLPGAEDLLGPRHNPAWRLAPSNAAAQKLLDAWRKDDEARTALWTFEGTDTRFLGDLYQDLSEDARERFALLQTPDFVERFILKLTLDPAVEEFGLDAVRLIDPTCGSGHFLLGAYDRLYDLRLALEPGMDRRAHALAALGHVHGVDLNPYAVAIARFRLTLSFLEKAGIAKLSAAPKLPLNLAVADSLLVAARGTTRQLAEDATDRTGWGFDLFDFEDEAEARRILGQGYHAVVGNPPYITCKDSVLRDEYRKLYRSCYREYALAAPFTERFFQLGEGGGFVGLINANSFMKREFGSRLIEEVLPKLDLTHVIDTSGAFIPGHGTPTVIIVGRNRAPGTDSVLAVLGKRGEPSTPDDPDKGLVWSTIAEHATEVGFENEFASVAMVARATLAKHPWSLGGGGAAELKESLDKGGVTTLGARASSMGFAAITGEDNVFLLPAGSARRNGVQPEHLRPMITGECLRDWALVPDLDTVWPCTGSGERLAEQQIPDVLQFFWPFRTSLIERKAFGRPILERGLPWWSVREVYEDRFKTPLTISFAFVATHNHFVLDRGGKVFNRSAPIIKLPESATDDDHLALLAYLNSSTACFWMKQIFHDKGSGTDSGKWQADPAKIAYEFTGTGLEALPVPEFTPAQRASLIQLARAAADRAAQRESLLPAAVSAEGRYVSTSQVRDALADAERRDAELLAELIGIQEEIDWIVYRAFRLTNEEPLEPGATPLGSRPFEIAAARRGTTTGTDGQPLSGSTPAMWEPARKGSWERRIAAIGSSRDLSLIEQPDYKRRWCITPKDFGGRVLTFQDRAEAHLRNVVLDLVEREVRTAAQPTTLRAISDRLGADASACAILEVCGKDGSITEVIRALVADESVPAFVPLRFTEAGMEKRALWERTWDLQRREDAGEKLVAPIPVPPKYDQKDYRAPFFWRLRGKLDVPKERFISYPGADRDDDKSPIIGWAGWGDIQRAQALAALYQERKEDAWTKERLAPLLAGLLELVPWLKQWHNEPNASFGGQKLGDYFAQYVDSEARENGLTLDELKAWRPPAKGKGKKK